MSKIETHMLLQRIFRLIYARLNQSHSKMMCHLYPFLRVHTASYVTYFPIHSRLELSQTDDAFMIRFRRGVNFEFYNPSF